MSIADNALTVIFSIDVVTGLESNTSGISVYPNPVVDRFTIQGSPQSWLMYAADGTKVDAMGETLSADKTVITVGHLPVGLYLLKVINHTGVSVMKIVKTN